MTRLFNINNSQLIEAKRKSLDYENKIQQWVLDDLSLVGVDGIVIGEQVTTDHGKRIDVLAMDREGNLIIIELKRDKSSRDLVAQALDYASWVCHLSTNEVYELALAKTGRPLSELYREKFGTSLPETLNTTHQMIVVASEVDEASKRIIEYLSEQHNVGINASFFNIFEHSGVEWLTTDTLLEQQEVKERATKKARGPWTGYYYTTGGTQEARPWEDMKKYGFITASGGKWYTDGLARLSKGDKVFYYQVNNGYLGYGIITSERQKASEFTLESGKKLIDVLPKSYLIDDADDPDLCAYIVGVNWKKAFNRDDAKSFQGIFANQNTACKLYSQETVDFLKSQFGINEED